jgi:transposase
VNKRFRVCDLNQPFLIPPSLQDWLPESHLARFIADVADELDLSGIQAEYERHDARGLSAYHPLLLTRLLLYGYSLGITSSRAIEKATYDNIAFRYLAADQHPDHDTIAAFRQQHLEALAELFIQALRLCQKAGLVKLGNVALDGTKMKANASTRRSVGYKQLKEREQYWQGVVEGLLKQAQQTDEEEDRRFGPGQPVDPLPEELASAKGRLERIRRAKAELEKEAKEQLQAAGQNYIPRKRGRPRKEEQETLSPRSPQQRRGDRKRFRRAKQNANEPSRQYNFVDPDSRVLRDSSTKSFVQGYNAQAGVDSHAQVIVAAEVTQQPTDRRQLVPMVNSVRATTESTPGVVTADAGYWDTESLQDPSLAGIQMLVSPDATPQPPAAPLPANAPRNHEALRMRELLASPAGKALYTQRKATVEAVFGQIKEARGIRRFRLRGLLSVRCEWKLICATHNLLKLFRHQFSLSPA